MPDVAILLGAGTFENHLYRFLFGVADEATCVDDDFVGIDTVGVVTHLEAGFVEEFDYTFAVNEVF